MLVWMLTGDKLETAVSIANVRVGGRGRRSGGGSRIRRRRRRRGRSVSRAESARRRRRTARSVRIRSGDRGRRAATRASRGPAGALPGPVRVVHGGGVLQGESHTEGERDVVDEGARRSGHARRGRRRQRRRDDQGGAHRRRNKRPGGSRRRARVDFSVGQFRFLAGLLLVHGRWSAKRNREVVLYAFYKNFVYTMANVWFGFLSAYSAQPIYTTAAIATFNVLWTSLPTVAFACFDQDVVASVALAHPRLYGRNRRLCRRGFRARRRAVARVRQLALPVVFLRRPRRPRRPPRRPRRRVNPGISGPRGWRRSPPSSSRVPSKSPPGPITGPRATPPPSSSPSPPGSRSWCSSETRGDDSARSPACTTSAPRSCRNPRFGCRSRSARGRSSPTVFFERLRALYRPEDHEIFARGGGGGGEDEKTTGGERMRGETLVRRRTRGETLVRRRTRGETLVRRRTPVRVRHRGATIDATRVRDATQPGGRVGTRASWRWSGNIGTSRTIGIREANEGARKADGEGGRGGSRRQVLVCYSKGNASVSTGAETRWGISQKREGLLFETIRSDRTADEKIRFQSEGVRFDRSSGFDRPRETYEFQTKNRRHPRANRSSLQCALPALSPADVAAPIPQRARHVRNNVRHRFHHHPRRREGRQVRRLLPRHPREPGASARRGDDLPTGPSAMEATSDYDHPRDDRGLTPLARAVFPQVRVAPRVGAKSARLSTVKTYAREVGMKKDGTSATVRPPPLSSHVEECPLRESPPSDRRAVPRADPTSPRRDDRRIPNDPRDLTSRSASDPRLSAPSPSKPFSSSGQEAQPRVRPGGRQALGVPGLRIHL